MHATSGFVAAVRSSGRSWLQERKRLYHEWERIREVEAQAKVLVKELLTRRDGYPPRTYDLWALREALAEVDQPEEN